MFRGQFRFKYKGIEQVIPNTITDEGEDSYIKMVFQNDQTIVAGGANFFLGLCGENGVASDATLLSITDEPAVSNGYARQPIARNSTGFPTIDVVNGVKRARSLNVQFAASGGDFTLPITRAFLCNIVSGTAGILFAFSGKLANPITVTPGTPLDTNYEVYFDGA